MVPAHLSSGSARRHQPVLASLLAQTVRYRGDQPAAGGSERVAQGQGAAP